MNTKTVSKAKASNQEPQDHDAIAAYTGKQSSAHTAIFQVLRTEIDKALPAATSKIWHGTPVWFVGQNPVAGYHVKAKSATLLFWNGQSFDEPALQSVGSFKAAEIQFADTSEIELTLIRRCLEKARTEIWDYKALRLRK